MTERIVGTMSGFVGFSNKCARAVPETPTCDKGFCLGGRKINLNLEHCKDRPLKRVLLELKPALNHVYQP